MDASAGAGAGRGVGSPVQNARKEWRVVSEHHSSSDGESDRLKVCQSDERTIYEQGRDHADVDFSSVTIEGGVQNDILQRLNQVSRQREELQQMEVELRARFIARSEIMQIQNRYETQIKEHANIAALLQEQVMDRDQTILELERKMEEKEREIHAVKLDNEAAWAKEGLLREQNKELASFRKERDNSEVERAQHFQQINDLQEHIKEKERQFLELQEQQRVAQETILFKDEQLREAQAWMTRAHEMDTLHSTTIHLLQAELRERTEQYNQLWVGCQRQFAEMERVHFNTIQQLQAELAKAREGNETHKDESAASHSSIKDAPQAGHYNGHLDIGGNVPSNGKSPVVSNGNEENATNTFTVGNASQAEHGPGVTFAPTLLGLSPYLSPGQMAVHPFMMNPASPHLPQNHAAHFQSVQPTLPIQYWQNQPYEMPVDGKTHPSQYVDTHLNQGVSNGDAASSNPEESKDERSMGNSYPVDPQSQPNVHEISSRFHDTLNLNHLEKSKIQEANADDSNDHERESRPLPNTNIGTSNKDIIAQSKVGETVNHAIVSSTDTNANSVEKISDSLLLDERLLLACIARTMPASGKIRISSTLPNRLAKMLAPLHWHDYKKTYGKLDDFVAGHPELFVIEGDFIQLREGAQKKIAATAAAAKIVAAAASPSPYSSALLLSSVAVTPMAQSYRLKKSPSSQVDPNPHFTGTQAQHSNGIHYHEANTVGSTNASVHANSIGRQHGRAPSATPNSQR